MTSFKRIWEPLPSASAAAAESASQTEFAFRPLWRGSKPPLQTADASIELPVETAGGTFAGEEDKDSPEHHELEPKPTAADTPSVVAAVAGDPVPPPAQPPEQAAPGPAVAQADFGAALEQARQAAFEAGKEQGRNEAEAAIASERAELRALMTGLDQAFEVSGHFFAPLKRLALHIAGTIVKVELESRADVIEGVVAGCLSGLDEVAVVRLRLNPADVDLLHAAESPLAGRLEILADEKISRGSAKAELADGWVEDFIEERWKAVHASLKVES